jgi:hypothetical protein
LFVFSTGSPLLPFVHPIFTVVRQISLTSPGTGYTLLLSIKESMTAQEIQDFIHLYSIVSFRGGRKESGILVNKYNASDACVEYYFIEHSDMPAYKVAFENYDRETCRRLSEKVNLDEIVNIRPVSLADYRIIMQLIDERNKMQFFNN